MSYKYFIYLNMIIFKDQKKKEILLMENEKLKADYKL